TVVLNEDGTVTFTPDAGFNGEASFSYVATDGTLDTEETAVTVNVGAGNNAPVVLGVSSSVLDKSLKELQTLGVNNVLLTGVAASDGLTVALGDGAALAATGLPLFGIDGNGDGMLTGTEIGTGNVTLALADAAQLGEAAALAGGLNAAGIDAVRIDLASGPDGNIDFNAELSALLGDSTLNADFAALHGAGLANQIDLGGADEIGHLTLSDMQAQQLIGAGVEFAAADAIALDAQGTHLSTSLKGLQKLGVDNVLLTGAVATDGLTVALGAGAALNAAGLPLFGDINGDGVLSQSELDAGHVTLAVDDAAQLGEAAALAGGLHAAGIDAVRMDLASGPDGNADYNAELSALLGDSTLNADFAALHGAGLANQIDLGGADEIGHLTLSDTQAQVLIGEGLEFAAADAIALDAQGTHLSTSLKGLQKLGVDNVLLTGAVATDGLTVALGAGAALNAAGLPLFGDINGDGVLSQSELDAGHVTLAVDDAAQLGEAAALAGGLHAAGIDAVRMDLASGPDGNADYNAELSALLGDSTLNADFAALHGAGLANQIDLGGAGEIGHVSLSDMQAQQLIGAGLEFAAADHISVDIGSAEGTHLSTSLKGLQKLGVDNVVLADSAGHNLTVDLGTGAALSATGLPLFGDTDQNGQLSVAEGQALDVTLAVANHNDLQSLQNVAGALVAAGIDHLAVDQSQLGDLTSDAAVSSLLTAGLNFDVRVDGAAAVNHARFEQAVDILKSGVDLLPNSLVSATSSTLVTLVDTLKASGIHSIDLGTNNSVTIGDGLAAALHDAGLLTALPQAEVWLDTSAEQLQTSLKAMADLGVDKVASTSDVAVKLGTNLAELGKLLQSFVEDGTTPITKPLFDHLAQLDVGTVADDATVQQTLSQAGVAQQLHDLGVSKVVAQVEVLGQSQSLEWTFDDISHDWMKKTIS
ncbi:cadherin-like domain-containing protein, partial [Malikia sp.]|uniref:cadherin-like domain-containing protein n=1 Tax=Malikia sp. TaxID=2070706 RepID=UPI00261E26DE